MIDIELVSSLMEQNVNTLHSLQLKCYAVSDDTLPVATFHSLTRLLPMCTRLKNLDVSVCDKNITRKYF
jgi:hypothetical protein